MPTSAIRTMVSAPAATPRIAAATILGVACGAAGLLGSALLFRSYGPPMASDAAETARQLGFPYLATELAVVTYARHRGLRYGQVLRAAPAWARAALVLFLATFWIGSAFASPNPVFSLALSIAWALQLPFAAAVWHLARRHGAADAAAVAAPMAAGLAILGLATAWHFLTPPPGLAVPWGPFGWGGAVPGFISHRLFGSWCAAVLALLLGLAWTGAERRLPRWLVPALLIAATLMLWTGTRAAVVGTAAAFLAAMAVERRAGSPRFWALVLLVALVAIPLGAALNPHGDPSFMFTRPPRTMTTAEGVSSGRLSYWFNCLRLAAQHPLFGWGAASSLWLDATGGGMRHVQPHNVLVQFLLNWGLVPTLPALALIGAGLVAAHRRVARDRARLPFLMALYALVVMGFLDGMFHFPQFLMLMALFGALCLARPERATP